MIWPPLEIHESLGSLSLPQQQCTTNRLGPSLPAYTWLDHINVDFTCPNTRRTKAFQCHRTSSPHGTHSFTHTRQSKMSDMGDRTDESPTPLSASSHQEKRKDKIGEKDICNPSSAVSAQPSQISLSGAYQSNLQDITHSQWHKTMDVQALTSSKASKQNNQHFNIDLTSCTKYSLITQYTGTGSQYYTSIRLWQQHKTNYTPSLHIKYSVYFHNSCIPYNCVNSKCTKIVGSWLSVHTLNILGSYDIWFTNMAMFIGTVFFFLEHHTITHNKDYKITPHTLEENLMYNIHNNKMFTWACALSYDT